MSPTTRIAHCENCFDGRYDLCPDSIDFAFPGETKREVRARRKLAALKAWQEKWDSFDGRCAYCGDPATTRDHVMPRALGGKDHIGNLVPACRRCNQLKADMHPEDWIELLRNPEKIEQPGMAKKIKASKHLREGGLKLVLDAIRGNGAVGIVAPGLLALESPEDPDSPDA